MGTCIENAVFLYRPQRIFPKLRERSWYVGEIIPNFLESSINEYEPSQSLCMPSVNKNQSKICCMRVILSATSSG